MDSFCSTSVGAVTQYEGYFSLSEFTYRLTSRKVGIRTVYLWPLQEFYLLWGPILARTAYLCPPQEFQTCSEVLVKKGACLPVWSMTIFKRNFWAYFLVLVHVPFDFLGKLNTCDVIILRDPGGWVGTIQWERERGMSNNCSRIRRDCERITAHASLRMKPVSVWNGKKVFPILCYALLSWRHFFPNHPQRGNK